MSYASGLLPNAVANGWPGFIQRHWEKTPAQFELPSDFALPSGHELMQLVLRATRAAPNSCVRVFRGHAAPLADARRFYPAASDPDLETYLNRATQMAGTDFTLIVNRAQLFGLEFCQYLREFSRGLFAEIGLPLHTDIVVYASRAERTAAGVHTDPFSNFLFPVIGRKRFRLWPAHALRGKPQVIGSAHYEEVLDESQVYEVERGDLLYIPSNYYHVAEAEQQPSVHVSMVISVGDSQAGNSSWRSRRLW